MPLHGALFVIYLAIIVVKIAAFIDAAIRPERNYVINDKKTKQFWLVVLGLAVLTSWFGFLNLIGLVAALVYWLDVRPAITAR
jgi:uncharacterized membrane protein YkvI